MALSLTNTIRPRGYAKGIFILAYALVKGKDIFKALPIIALYTEATPSGTRPS